MKRMKSSSLAAALVGVAAFALSPLAADAAPGWTCTALDTANPPEAVPAYQNAIRGVNPTEYVNGGSAQAGANAVRLSDGEIPVHTNLKTIELSNNSSLTYAVGEAGVGIDLKGINVYSSWGDAGRVQISISSVSIRTVEGGDAWTELANSAVTSASSSVNGYLAAYRADADASIATGVTAIKIVFPAQQNGYVGYGEIEVLQGGEAKIPIVFSCLDGFGTVVSEPASSDWTFSGGTVVKLTATSSDGSVFDRWVGDVDRAHRFDNPLTVTVNDTVNLTPVFRRPWVWENNSMSDGYWTVNTSANGESGLAITKVTAASAETCPLVNFNKTITGTDRVLLSINDSVMNSKSSISEIDFADTMTTINDSCRWVSDLVSVHLPTGLVTLGHCAFYSCTKLAYVEPLLPDTMTGWGGAASGHMQQFQNCPLTGTFRISNPSVPYVPASICQAEGNVMTNVDLTGSGVAAIYDSAFRTCSKLTDAYLPASLTYLDNCVFYSCSSLKSVYFLRALESFHDGAFNGWPSTARIVVSPADKNTFISQAASWTAWENVAVGDKTTYANTYDDDMIPLGRIKLGSSGTTVYLAEKPVTSIQLSVRTEPEDADLLASVSPACEDNTEITKSYVSTVPSTVSGTDRHCAATGYRLYRYENDEWTLVKTVTGGATSAAFADATSGNYKLVWTFDTLGYAIHLTPVSETLGATVLSAPDVQGAYYAPGTTVTATTTENEGKFFSYVLNGTELAKTKVANFTVNGICNLVPCYQWHWFADSKTLANGDWVLNGTDLGEAKIRIDSVKTQGQSSKIDWTMGADNATIFSVGQRAFMSNSFITEVLLPDTVTELGEDSFRQSSVTKVRLSSNLATLGHCAFWCCYSLTTVEPFLPDSLASLPSTGENFNGCPIVAEKLVVSNRNLTKIGDNFLFSDSASVGEIDLSGSSVESIGQFAFRGIDNLKKVTFPKTLKTLVHCAFHNACSSLEQLVFLGPAVTFTTSECFQGWSNLQVRIYIPQGDATWDAYFEANPTRITDMTDGEIEAFKAKYPGEKAPKKKIQLPNFGTWQYLCHLPSSGFSFTIR